MSRFAWRIPVYACGHGVTFLLDDQFSGPREYLQTRKGGTIGAMLGWVKILCVKSEL